MIITDWARSAQIAATIIANVTEDAMDANYITPHIDDLSDTDLMARGANVYAQRAMMIRPIIQEYWDVEPEYCHVCNAAH